MRNLINVGFFRKHLSEATAIHKTPHHFNDVLVLSMMLFINIVLYMGIKSKQKDENIKE